MSLCFLVFWSLVVLAFQLASFERSVPRECLHICAFALSVLSIGCSPGCHVPNDGWRTIGDKIRSDDPSDTYRILSCRLIVFFFVSTSKSQHRHLNFSHQNSEVLTILPLKAARVLSTLRSYRGFLCLERFQGKSAAFQNDFGNPRI